MCQSVSSSQGLALVEYHSFLEIHNAGPPGQSYNFLIKWNCCAVQQALNLQPGLETNFLAW